MFSRMNLVAFTHPWCTLPLANGSEDRFHLTFVTLTPVTLNESLALYSYFPDKHAGGNSSNVAFTLVEHPFLSSVFLSSFTFVSSFFTLFPCCQRAAVWVIVRWLATTDGTQTFEPWHFCKRDERNPVIPLFLFLFGRPAHRFCLSPLLLCWQRPSAPARYLLFFFVHFSTPMTQKCCSPGWGFLR